MKTQFSRRAFAIRDVLAALATASVCSSLLLAGINKNREAACQAQCRNNLRKISQGWTAYTKTEGHFPRGSLGGPWYNGPGEPFPTGDTIHESCGGWMWQILPHNGRQDIYLQKNAKSNYDAIAMVYKTVIPEYLCPSRSRPPTYTCGGQTFPRLPQAEVEKAHSDYAASTGSSADGVFEYLNFPVGVGNNMRKFNRVKESDVTDGLANTIFFAERWVKDTVYNGKASAELREIERKLQFAQVYHGWADHMAFYSTVGPARTPRGPEHDSFSRTPQKKEYPLSGSAHPRVMMACAGDGSVRHIAYTIDPAVWVALCSRNDGVKAEWPVE